MKVIGIYIVVWISATCLASGSDTLDLILKTEKSIPQPERHSESIVEMPAYNLAKIDSFDKIQKNFSENWRNDLKDLETVAPSENAKVIFLKAAEILPRKQYIEFLMESCELVDRKVLSKQQLKWALFPSDERLSGLWTDKAPSESLKELSIRLKQVYLDEPELLQFFDNVLSGAAAQGAKKYREDYYGPPREPLRPNYSSNRNNPENKKSLRMSLWRTKAPMLLIVVTVIIFFVILGRILFSFLKRKNLR